MNKFVTILFLLLSFLATGQSVTAPVAKSFSVNTTGQDASGFILNGFTSTDILLTSISLVTFPTGTTFNLNTTTGLTAASGFTLTGTKTRLVVTGTMANINTALASLKINTGTTKGTIKISVAATINPTGYYYNGVNGHFYKPVTTGTTYTSARAASLTTTFKGQTGYLVTITSASENAFIFSNVPQANIWFAATDEVIDGKWVIDAGPEKGTVMKTANGQLNGNIAGVYNNWAGGEPNGSNHSEDYAVTNWNGQSTWNDLSNNWNNPYIIEYGTWSNPDDQTFTEFYTNSTSHTNGAVLSANFNFNIASGIDKTSFSGKIAYFTNPNIWTNISTTAKPLSGLGKVDMSADFDTTKTNMGFVFQSYPTATLSTLTNQIVTVSDVYLAFKELSNKGLSGDGGYEFTSGIQYMNADVNGDNLFNEEDTYRLLQHLTGARNLTDNCNTLSCWMKLMSTTDYNSVTKLNWGTFGNNSKDTYAPLNPIARTYAYNYDVNVFWKGDVNLSHSPTQSSVVGNSMGMMNRIVSTPNNVINASILSENIGGKVIVTITLDPLEQNLVGAQFHLNYDNSVLQFEKIECNAKATNFGSDNGSYINLGSLITSGLTTLDKTTEYKIIFVPKIGINGILGLTSISVTDAVNQKGIQLKVNLN
jgi:Cohesin domain/Lectin C-type domain